MESQSENFLHSLSKSVDISFQPIFVLPGQSVTKDVTRFKKNIVVGDGLYQDVNTVKSNIGGKLRYREPVSYWIDANVKNYVPKHGDQIVGIIEDRGGEYYRVNIFSGAAAILNKLSFEGATKRNKPELRVGDVVYCKVSQAHKHLDTELTCISSFGVKKGWSSGETIYGELVGGLTVKVTPLQARMLLKPDCFLLNILGSNIPFELAVGMNGFVWIRTNSEEECILIRNAILNFSNLDDFQIEAMVEILMEKLKSIQGRTNQL